MIQEEISIEWIAGFLEGEGSFGIKAGRLRVAATQAEREPLDLLYARFGGSLTLHRRAGMPGQGNRRDLWQYGLHGRPAGEVMALVLPYLTSRRRDQIARAVARSAPSSVPAALHAELRRLRTVTLPVVIVRAPLDQLSLPGVAK